MSIRSGNVVGNASSALGGIADLRWARQKPQESQAIGNGLPTGGQWHPTLVEDPEVTDQRFQPAPITGRANHDVGMQPRAVHQRYGAAVKRPRGLHDLNDSDLDGVNHCHVDKRWRERRAVPTARTVPHQESVDRILSGHQSSVVESAPKRSCPRSAAASGTGVSRITSPGRPPGPLRIMIIGRRAHGHPHPGCAAGGHVVRDLHAGGSAPGRRAPACRRSGSGCGMPTSAGAHR